MENFGAMNMRKSMVIHDDRAEWARLSLNGFFGPPFFRQNKSEFQEYL